MKEEITPEEYEQLADQTQRRYTYCGVCNLYYLMSRLPMHKYHAEPIILGAYAYSIKPESMKQHYHQCPKCGKYVRNDQPKCLCERSDK